jgi:hypothetical protein
MGTREGSRLNILEAKRIWTPASQKAAEVTAARIRIQRVEFFKRIISAERGLRAMLDYFTDKIEKAVFEKASDPKNTKRIHELIHDQSVTLRASMRIWVNAAIRDSAKMGFRHIGDALRPVFKASLRESVGREITADRAIYEARLQFDVSTTLAANAGLAVTTSKWIKARQALLTKITKKNLAGLNPSERVWELTNRAEMDLKRIVTNGISQSENPAVIARRIRKYISPTVEKASKLGVEPGPGVYRSPYRNAMRLARTEMAKTYVKAQARFAKDKPWVAGAKITLSKIHSVADECDELAAMDPMSVEEAESYLPAHPHCGCSITPIIDPKYLGETED